MNTPISSRSAFSRSNPESRSACQAACTPNCEKRSVRRISLGDGKAGVGSKFFTSAAICVSKLAASNEVILSTPHLPAIRLVQKASRSLPRGGTTPKPVITTLRSVQSLAINQKGQLKLIPVQAAPKLSTPPLFLLLVFDVFDHIS